jgi:hypothetical protein
MKELGSEEDVTIMMTDGRVDLYGIFSLSIACIMYDIDD